MQLSRVLGLSGLVVCLLAPGEPAAAETPTSRDATEVAASIAAPGVVEIETRDESGEPRRTKIWIVSQAEMVYVRTTDSRWNGNLLRDGKATLHSEASTADATAEQVSDAELQSSVNALFAEKYGFSNTLRNLAVGLGSANMWALTLATP